MLTKVPLYSVICDLGAQPANLRSWLYAFVSRFNCRVFDHICHPTLNSAVSLQHCSGHTVGTTRRVSTTNDMPCRCRHPCNPRLITQELYLCRLTTQPDGSYITLEACRWAKQQLVWKMFSQDFCVLALLATVNALPTRWRSATVKRNVVDLDTEYDYIVGEYTRLKVWFILTGSSGRWHSRHNSSRPTHRRRYQ